MKRFAKLLLVTFGFGVFGFAMSLVPQKTATGAAAMGPAVTVTNFPGTLTGATVPVSIAGTVAVSSLPSVNLGGASSVNVNNPSSPGSSAVQVRDVNQGLQPIMLSASFTLSSAEFTTDAISLLTVPTGKRFVAEYLAGTCGLPAGQAIDVFVFPQPNNGLGGVAVTSLSPVAPPSSSSASSTQVGQPIVFYADAGENVSISLARTDNSGLASCQAFLNGHLIDVP